MRSDKRIAQIALGTNPHISRMVSKYSFTETHRAVTDIIFNAISQLNVGKQMDAKQFLGCAQSLMGEYHTYKLDDFYRCMQNGITGKYGQIYDRIDISVISLWFKAYDTERDEAIIEQRSKEASQHKAIDIGALDERVLAYTTREELKPTEPIPVSQEENLTPIQTFMKDFDVEHKINPAGKGVMRMINYGGNIVTQDEYLVLRIEETINK